MNDKSIANLEQLENGTPNDKIITLRGVFKTKHKIQPAYDPKISWYAGVARISDDAKKDLNYYVTVGEIGDKARNNTFIELYDGYEFDLNNEVDVINWEWVKHCKEVAPSFEDAQISKIARYYVVIAGREARKSNDFFALKNKATTFVLEDSPVNYENRALLLGFDMKGEPIEAVKLFLLEQADNKKTAKKVIDVYTNKALNIQLLYLKAKQKNIVNSTANGAIKFGMQVIGMSDESAIVFLQDKDNKEVLDLLEREVNPEYFVDKSSFEKPVVLITEDEKHDEEVVEETTNE